MRIATTIKRLGFGSDVLHTLGIASLLASVSLWGKSAAHSDEARKARAQRLAIFVGLWPPTFFLLGKVVQDLEATPEQQVEKAARLQHAA